MEPIEERCQHLLDRRIASTSLDLFACFILFIMMHWIGKLLGNRSSLFLRASLLLQFLWSYVLNKLCPKYITLLLSYLCIILCKFVLLDSIPKAGFSLVTRNRGKIIVPNNGWFCMSACLLITTTFLLEPSVVRYCYLSNHSPICSVETSQENSNPSRQTEEIEQMTLTRYDKRIVMQRLCQHTKEEGDEIDEDITMGYQEFSDLFKDSEPSLDELREAFSFFDQDGDGFIDARELQIVMTKLGLGVDINFIKSQLMIEQHDRGRDGKISMNDFSRLLETSFICEKGN